MLLVCEFDGFVIFAWLLGNNYSSLLRIRPGVRVPVVLLLTNFLSHTELVCCCAASSFLLRVRAESGCAISVRQFAVVQVRRVCHRGAAVRPLFVSGASPGKTPAVSTVDRMILAFIKSEFYLSAGSPFNIGVDHNCLLRHLCSAVCCCADCHCCGAAGQASWFGSCCCCRVSFLIPAGAAVQLLRSCCESGLCHLCPTVCCSSDSSGLPSLWGCRAVAVHPCYDSDQASGFRSCCCNDTGTEEAHCKYGSPICFLNFGVHRTL